MTSNHSSSFIRIIMLSLVIPALLTSTVTGPYCSAIAFSTASTDSEDDTSSAIPVPVTPCSAKRSLIACAPDSDVAVPTTVIPALPNSRAIALPIPRLAPVTSATFSLIAKSLFLIDCELTEKRLPAPHRESMDYRRSGMSATSESVY